MVLNKKTGEIEHRIFKEVINYFDEGDMFIFNDTQVFPAKLDGNKEKTGARIEVFLLRELNSEHKLWDVLVEPARKIRIGNKLYFGEDESMVAEVIDNTTSRGRTLRFLYDGSHEEFKEALFKLGMTPLPDYITRPATEEDAERYQCIFAKNKGAVVAPAAGMHFSRELLKRMEIKGVERAFLTLHSGRGNYREIDVEDLTKHRMDSEEMVVDGNLVDIVNAAKDRESKVCAVGTSVLRGIASSVCMNGHIMTYSGWTWEELQEMAKTDAGVRDLLSVTRYLVDGPFLQEKRDITLRFRGSANQHIRDIDRWPDGDVLLLDEDWN
jgi:S-adenosylmethionine:tRNA ribosyltransferase-isomerase